MYGTADATAGATTLFTETAGATALFTVIAAIVFLGSGLYRGVWRYASLNDLFAITRAVSMTVVIFAFAMFIWMRLEPLPRSVLLPYLVHSLDRENARHAAETEVEEQERRDPPGVRHRVRRRLVPHANCGANILHGWQVSSMEYAMQTTDGCFLMRRSILLFFCFSSPSSSPSSSPRR